MNYKGEERRLTMDRRDFELCPRFDRHELSEEQILDIAKRAVVLARDDFYMDVGRSVINKFFWIIGAVTIGIVSYLQANHIIKIF